MPDPTREQFEAAAKKVAAAHKEGEAPLSREQFYAAITRELSLGKPTSNPGTETDNPSTAYWNSLKKTASDTGSGILKGLKSYLPEMKIKPPPTKDQLEAGVASVTAPPAPGPSLADNFRDLTDPTKGGEVIGQLIPQLVTSMGSRVPIRSTASTALRAGADIIEHPLRTTGGVMRKVAGAIGTTPPAETPVDRFMPNKPAQPNGFGESAEDILHPAVAESPIDRFMPNRSGDSNGFGESAEGISHPAQSPIDRYMPNVGGAPVAEPPSTSRVPYGIPQESPEGGAPQPSLESMLMSILQDIRATPESPNLGRGSTLAPTPGSTMTPGGRPSVTAEGYDAATAGAEASPVQPPYVPPAEETPSLIPSSGPPRLVGKAPTLEEELLKIVESMRQPDDPRITSLPPEPSTTTGGPFKQSGKFGKSGSLGQAGGYSSGNPSRGVEDTIYENVLPNMGGTGPEEPPPSSTHGPTDLQGRPLRPVANQGLEKPRVTFREAIANLRANVGARDAAYAMGGKDAGYTRKTIQELAPGPSRIPNEAEGRIQDFLMKMAMKEDNK